MRDYCGNCAYFDLKQKEYWVDIIVLKHVNIKKKVIQHALDILKGQTKDIKEQVVS